MSDKGFAGSGSWYPPGPRTIPPDLTKVPPGYIQRAILVLVCLYLFVMVYLALVVGSIALLYWTYAHLPWHLPFLRGTAQMAYFLFIKIPAMLGSAMLCLFFIKGLFKRAGQSGSGMIELDEREHPRLFTFIRQLCQEVQAPLPKQVYIDHRVNAAVFYHASLFGLFLPVRKNLLIGLGLVNVLNLSEFKAALAHEFGHFSQSTMKLGSYVYVVSRLIFSMVYDRDWWDDYLDKWKSADIRFSWLAYGLSGVTWMLRKFLIWLLQLIVLVELGLSRAMEFHADKVAVSAAGSEAHIRALYKVYIGNEMLLKAMEELYWASERELYSRDLFYHQTRALEHLRRVKQDANFGKLPPIAQDPHQRTPLFPKEEDEPSSAWDTHPPNYLREFHACQPYVVATYDERSPWLLFGRTPELAVQLRETVTERFYREELGIRKADMVLQDPSVVQKAVDEEQKILTFDPKYRGLYDDRYLYAEDLSQWLQEAPRLKPETCRRWLREVFAQDWRTVREEIIRRQIELYLVDMILQNQLGTKPDKFPALGRDWAFDQAPQVKLQLEDALQTARDRFRQADRKIFLAYYTMARELSPQIAERLISYYCWARRVEEWLQYLQEWARYVDALSEAMTNDPDFIRKQGLGVVQALCDIRRRLQPVYEEMLHARVPKLLALKEEPPAARVFFPDGVVPVEAGDGELSVGEWVGNLCKQLQEAPQRGKRLYQRTVNTILAVQEEIDRRWVAQRQNQSGQT